MFAVQISDQETFVAKAKTLRHPVTVVRTATVVPIQQDDVVLMRPAVAINYVMEFEDPSTGATRWTFREVFSDKQGKVNLIDSLWNKLIAEPPASVSLVHRSGSI